MKVSAEGLHSGWTQTLGLALSLEGVTVTGRLPISGHVLASTGHLHHGVPASIVETLASVAAALDVGDRGQVVGVSNQTDTFSSPRSGELHASARPIDRSASEQLWRVDVVDDEGELVASGQVRLAVLRSAAGRGTS